MHERPNKVLYLGTTDPAAARGFGELIAGTKAERKVEQACAKIAHRSRQCVDQANLSLQSIMEWTGPLIRAATKRSRL